ncbi:MAG: helix-turn-helix transcriptional regulator [Bacteriovoracaceae bacterium]|nr:helix-turn-helix transcriptional regulator [Bacteriovoracaceae bacterium]
MQKILKSDKVFLLSSLFLIFVGCLSVVDVYMDKNDQLATVHLVGEFILIFISFSGSAFFIYHATVNKEKAKSLRSEVHDLKLKNVHYLQQIQSYKKGLSDAIDEEFNRWALTPSEKEVGIMLIKGLGYSEIANARAISERTARSQGSSILMKSGLKNKSELIAYFLEDLLYPNT